MKKLLVILMLLVFLSVYQIRLWVVETGPLTDKVNVIIPKGASSLQVAEQLADRGVIRHPQVFRVAARFNGLDKKLRAGEYQFDSKISMLNVMEKIAKGEVFYRKITFSEGLTTGQILYQLASTPEFDGEISIDVKEGELLPETYTYEYGASRDSIIIQAKKAMEKTVEHIWNSRDLTVPVKNKNQLMTLASIIEKETGIAEERALVASVFVNRLRKGMRLQTDPTVIYAITEGQSELGRSLKKADLNVDSPYNTYKYYGLPPAPICNPGRDAIEAAAHPEASNFLYFVASGDGGHNFSTNLGQHNQNVKNWVKKIFNKDI